MSPKVHNLHSGCVADISQHRIQSGKGIRTWRRSLQIISEALQSKWASQVAQW